MTTLAQIGRDFKSSLDLEYFPIGLSFRKDWPEAAVGFKHSGSGCIMPLILSAARGKTVAFDHDRIGWPCSGFYLGFRDSIYPGIEYYLSDGLADRECERFVESPEKVREYLQSVRFTSEGVAVFEPLEQMPEDITPEVVIFFADPDQLSALAFLAHFDAPLEERIVTRFASACGAVALFPLRNARHGEAKAFWGMQDISARARLPANVMSFAMPYAMAVRMHSQIGASFLTTSQWAKLIKRKGTAAAG